jgi:hypothetical protein
LMRWGKRPIHAFSSKNIGWKFISCTLGEDVQRAFTRLVWELEHYRSLQRRLWAHERKSRPGLDIRVRARIINIAAVVIECVLSVVAIQMIAHSI